MSGKEEPLYPDMTGGPNRQQGQSTPQQPGYTVQGQGGPYVPPQPAPVSTPSAPPPPQTDQAPFGVGQSFGSHSQPPPQQPFMQQDFTSPTHPPQPFAPGGTADCRQCGLAYPLPEGATSWRCKNCNLLNTTTGDQCTLL
ncbi:Uncharacterized protein PBTT_01946 [Plasmodiophora brassicae]